MADLPPTPTAHFPPRGADATIVPPGGTGPLDFGRAFVGARYVPQRPHAEGGLGRVYVALDREFGREVALKRLKDDVALSADDVARFEREGVLTGRLEHPGIVPVYGLGRDETGQPYYAMRFVRGESLQAAVARFHAPGRVDFAALEFRTLLARFVAACNAVAYAHSCGVVHRDLKPANVMLGPFGEALVVDWGLAREDKVRSSEFRVPSLDLTANANASATDATLPGSIIGTPAYMSPEQANGDAVGPAGDIYSLGAMLYVLLAGVTPFPGQDVLSILQAVKAGRVPPPRFWKPDLPAALEAICRKAMALAPADRYAGALDLAQDVERWLADEPVTAYVEPPLARVGRWVRGHRTFVGSAAAAAVVGLLGLGLTALLLGAANARERQARAEADNNFARARSAVDDMLTAVGDHPRLKQGDFHAVRKELLAKAVPYYEEFARQKGDDPAVRLDRARALKRLGELRIELGEPAAALDEFQAAEALLDPPADAERRTLLVLTLERQALALRNLGRRPEAEAVVRRAAEWHERIVAAAPGDVRALARWAMSLSTLGVIVMEERRFADAEVILRRSVAVREPALAAAALTPDERIGLAMTLNNLGNALADSKRNADAEPQYRRALDLLAQVVADDPKQASARRTLVTGRANLATLLRDLKRFDQSEAEHRRTAGEYDRLIADFPALPLIRREAARNRNNFARLLQDRGRFADAEVEYRAALVERQKLAQEFPSERGFQGEIARNHNNLGRLYHDLKRWDEAATEYHLAVKELTALGGDDPAGMPNAVDLGDAWTFLGRLERDRDRVPESLPWLTKAVDFLTTAQARNAQSPQLRKGLRVAHRWRGDVLIQLGRAADGLADWDRAVALCNDDSRPEYRLGRARAWAQTGSVEKAVVEIDEALVGAKGEHLVEAARALAVVAEVGDTATRDARQARAIALLQKAAGDGQLSAEQLRPKEFDALRGRAEFQKLADPGRP